MSALKAQVDKANLVKNGNDAERMLDRMYAMDNTIVKHDGKEKDFSCYIFQALFSGSHQVFQNFIQYASDEWDLEGISLPII